MKRRVLPVLLMITHVLYNLSSISLSGIEPPIIHTFFSFAWLHSIWIDGDNWLSGIFPISDNDDDKRLS